MCSLAVAPQPLPPPEPFSDLLPELAARIASVVAPTEQVQLVPMHEEGADQTELRQIGRQLALLVTSRGLRLTDRAGAALVISFTCSQNLRERVCAADIRKGDTSELVMATRMPDKASKAGPAAIPLVLEVRPLFADETQILDVMVIGRRLLVLYPSVLTMYERTDEEWRILGMTSISSARARPRDVRGRLHVPAEALRAKAGVDRTTFDVYLPGVSCRGTLEPLTVTCADEQRAWPVGIENAGIDASRNYFAMPDGQAFYAIGSLGPDAGARWLVVARDGRLVFLDDRRQHLGSTSSTPPGSASDVVAVTTRCAAGSHVLVSSRSATAGDGEALALFRVVARQLIPVTPPLVLPGLITALWPTPDAAGAIAVLRDGATERYAAFQIGVSCGR